MASDNQQPPMMQQPPTGQMPTPGGLVPAPEDNAACSANTASTIKLPV